MKTKPMFHKKKYEKEEDADGFIFEDILFKNTEDGKVRCGVCQVECSRLIVHMNGNEYCTEYFSNMATFKLEYSKYRHKKSKRSQEEKDRHEKQGSTLFLSRCAFKFKERNFTPMTACAKEIHD